MDKRIRGIRESADEIYEFSMQILDHEEPEHPDLKPVVLIYIKTLNKRTGENTIKKLYREEFDRITLNVKND